MPFNIHSHIYIYLLTYLFNFPSYIINLFPKTFLFLKTSRYLILLKPFAKNNSLKLLAFLYPYKIFNLYFYLLSISLSKITNIYLPLLSLNNITLKPRSLFTLSYPKNHIENLFILLNLFLFTPLSKLYLFKNLFNN